MPFPDVLSLLTCNTEVAGKLHKAPLGSGAGAGLAFCCAQQSRGWLELLKAPAGFTPW